MASNWIPQRDIILGLDNNTVIGLAKPTILQKSILMTDNSWTNSINTRVGIYYAWRRLNNSNEVQIMGAYGTYSNESIANQTFSHTATTTFTIADKTIDYVQLTLGTKLYSSYYWMKPAARLMQKWPSLFPSGTTCMVDKIGINFRLDPELVIDTITYTDAGNLRTYTVNMTITYKPNIDTFGIIPDSNPGAGAYLDGRELGGDWIDWDFNSSYYRWKKFTTLIPNSELAILAQARLSDGVVVSTTAAKSRKSRLLSFISTILKK